MALQSPLDSPFIQRIVDHLEQSVTLEDSSCIKLDSFLAVRHNPNLISDENPDGESRSWIHILSLISSGLELTAWMTKTRKRSLICIDGMYLCPFCCTSEYIRSNKKLNVGKPTCIRCSSTLLNSSLEL